jgi:glycosyltransferase involved in cell wall biosynthesis
VSASGAFEPTVVGSSPVTEGIERMASVSADAGLRRIGMVAWRDLDDPEAGGSELHAHEIASRWAAAGIEVVMRTSAVAGAAPEVSRNGYRVVRRAGRYAVFAQAPVEMAVGRFGPVGRLDGVVEIWNGMPFLSPLWWRGPRVVFLHHVHAEMWKMVLPPRLAAAGNALESRLAPPLYRRSRIVTLSESSRQEIIDSLGMRPDRVSVVAPGIDERFAPGSAGSARAIGTKADHPLVVAVGRLVPVKQFDRVIAAAQPLAALHPDLEIVIVGEGYERPALEAAIEEAGAGNIVRLAGRLSEDELLALYRKAWVLISTSAREGWGMTVTEAAASGTAAVVSRIAGHLDAVEDGVTGLLFDNEDQFVKSVDSVLADGVLRAKMSRAARERSAGFSWEATAVATLELLAAEAGSGSWRRRRRRRIARSLPRS